MIKRSEGVWSRAEGAGRSKPSTGGHKCSVRTCDTNHVAGFSKADVRLGFAEGDFRNNSRGGRAEDMKITNLWQRRDGQGEGGVSPGHDVTTLRAVVVPVRS